MLHKVHVATVGKHNIDILHLHVGVRNCLQCCNIIVNYSLSRKAIYLTLNTGVVFSP